MWYLCFGVLFTGFCQSTEGGFYFTKEPEPKIYFLKGTNASFEWKYVVDDMAAEFRFVRIAAQNTTTLAYSQLMYKQADLVVKLGPRLPPSYVGRVEGKGQATLVITSVIFEDSTLYRCRLDAKDGGFNESYIQLVVIGPVFVTPAVQCAELGSSVTFTCTATAVPSQNFTWIKLDRTERIVDGGQYSIISNAGSSRLIIKNVSADDHGYYACDASMNSEQPNKAIVYLHVPCKDPPREDKTYCRETSYRLSRGDNQTVCCPVSGYPPPFVTWKKNGIQFNQESSVLKIYNLANQDFGNYTCTATNFETTVSVDVFIEEKVGLSLDIIDGSKLNIHPLGKVKQYIVKVSGEDILDDYFTGATTSLEIFYHTLRMKTSSGKPKETKINAQVFALTDEGYRKSPVKILTIRSHQVILKADISLVLLVLFACLTW